VQQFCLEENGLFWLCGDLEKKQEEKNATATKNNEDEGVQINASDQEKENEGKAETGGWCCIPKMMQ